MDKIRFAHLVDYNTETTHVEIKGKMLKSNGAIVRQLNKALEDGIYVVETGQVSGWGSHNALIRRHPDVWGELQDVPDGDYLVTLV